MARNDIRFSGEAATVEHHSARGKVTRNAGNFTRGSQLVTHEFWMWIAGARIPFFIWFIVFASALSITLALMMQRYEIQLVLMRLWSSFWLMMDFDQMKIVNVTLPTGRVQAMPMGYVPYDAFIAAAWDKAVRCFFGSGFIAIFIAAPLTLWFVDFSRRRGKSILQERHERGALLVPQKVLLDEVSAHNAARFVEECRNAAPPRDPKFVNKLSRGDRAKLGIHQPCSIAGIPYPWRLEQSHTMLIGTTGTGKTTHLRSLVTQLRARGQRAVIFDLTGAFVETFYDEDNDIILNPMDQRCRPWTIFNDCDIYADFLSAASALIPSDPGDKEPFWQQAARTLFVEICMKLQADGETSNAAIAHHLMTAELKKIHAKLEDTVAAPLTTEKAARMAESIRSVFNTNGNVLRFLPDPKKGGAGAFSIVDWMTGDAKPGSILFITSSHTDLALTRPLLTLWMDVAVNSLMRMSRTRDLRTWFLFDEVHALHALPAIEHGLQTARNFGGAFVLGIHSFDKLAETYGEQGAVSLAGLARTKLILSTADYTSAERCAEFIGNREVRQMDEAYSYGYNNTRDASTLTPRKMIEPLVIPDDIMNLPSMHGFVKFPDGFPAARIKLNWRDYPVVADGFHRVTEMKPSEYVPPGQKGRATQPSAKRKSAEDGAQGGREATPLTEPVETAKGDGYVDPNIGEVLERRDPHEAPEAPQDNRSDAERAATAMEVRGDASNVATHTEHRAAEGAKVPDQASIKSAASAGGQFDDMSDPRLHSRIEHDQTEINRTQAQTAMTEKVLGQQDKDRPEEQILRETREGAGVASLHGDKGSHAHTEIVPELDHDDGYGMGD